MSGSVQVDRCVQADQRSWWESHRAQPTSASAPSSITPPASTLPCISELREKRTQMKPPQTLKPQIGRPCMIVLVGCGDRPQRHAEVLDPLRQVDVEPV